MSDPYANLAIQWFDEVWNHKNPDTIRELLSPDCVSHGSSETGDDLHGPEGFLQLHARLLNAFPDLHMSIDDAFSSGDKVVVRWTATMHHLGDGLGMAPTGAEITVRGMGIARIANGQFVEIWDSWDKLAMFQAIHATQAKNATA